MGEKKVVAYDEAKALRNALRRTNRARKFPKNTCPASRHLHMMAECLAKGKPYWMFEEEPQNCAITMLSVLESLWTLRTKAGWPDDKELHKFERAIKKATGS